MKEAHVCENVEDVILLQHLLVGLLLKVSKGQCNPREQSDLSPEALLEMVESAWSAGSAHDWTCIHISVHDHNREVAVLAIVVIQLHCQEFFL